MISIVTPTYNRAHTLQTLFNSLKNQSCSDFEWIVINDGSNDNTDYIMASIQNLRSKFNIIYKKQNNMGKHVAVNTAIKLATGEFTFIVDSDDKLTEDAIEKITRWCLSIKEDPTFAGVSGLKGTEKNKLIGNHPNFGDVEKYIDASNIQRKSKKLLGDKAEVYRTDLLRRYPFPVYNSEIFVSEAIVWDRIASDGYTLRWYNHIIYLCDYNEDGLTMQGNELFIKNFEGFKDYIRQSIKYYPLISKVSFLDLYLEVAKEKGIYKKNALKLIGVPRYIYCLSLIKKGMSQLNKGVEYKC